MKFKTEQENFWAGDFGREYIRRNRGEDLVDLNIALFKRILFSTKNVASLVELGCNIGLNLQALKKINKKFELCGYEINSDAAENARNLKYQK